MTATVIEAHASLPAVIVGAVLARILYLGGEMAINAWFPDESMRHVVVVNPQNGGGEGIFPGGTYFSQWWQAPDGTLLNDDEAQRLIPAGVADPYAWLYDNLKTVMTGVPGTLYPQWSLMETTGYGLVGVGALILAFPVVSRRRPQ
jgi:hypothetical protein